MRKRILLMVFVAVTCSYPVTVNFKCALPAVNWLYLDSDGSKQSEIGGWFLGFGYEWHFPRTLYFALNADFLATYVLPTISAGMISNDGLNELCLSAQAGMRFNRLSFGAGPLYGKMHHVKRGADPNYGGFRMWYSAEVLGFNLCGNYQLTDRILIGLNYRPNFYNLTYGRYCCCCRHSHDKFDYSHSISLSAILKLSREMRKQTIGGE